jgi:hypothetical protein
MLLPIKPEPVVGFPMPRMRVVRPLVPQRSVRAQQVLKQ